MFLVSLQTFFYLKFAVLQMNLTKLQLQSKYPEVYESYILQASLTEAKYEEKMVSHYSPLYTLT